MSRPQLTYVHITHTYTHTSTQRLQETPLPEASPTPCFCLCWSLPMRMAPQVPADPHLEVAFQEREASMPLCGSSPGSSLGSAAPSSVQTPSCCR